MKFLFTLLLLALLGCGASQPADEAALAQISKAASARRLAAIPPAITATAFLDWAERSFPAYFPSPAQSIPLSGFVLRYYPGSLIYLGVRDDGAIFALGPITENQVVALGTWRTSPAWPRSLTVVCFRPAMATPSARWPSSEAWPWSTATAWVWRS